MNRPPRPRPWLRWLSIAAAAGLGACSWLEAEFSSLDRVAPPTARAVGVPDSALADRP